MKYSLLEVAFSALMHDIGKFYQRTKIKSDLTEDELKTTPLAKNAYYHTHLHSGYTSRFFKEYLKIQSDYEMLTSSHHLNEENEFAELIRKADRIASAIDRNDEYFDYLENNQSGKFQQIRLSSVISEIDFGLNKENGIFRLSSLSDMGYPSLVKELKTKDESVEEYKRLFEDFILNFEEDDYINGKINKYLFDRMYALLYEYTTSIPASTYEGNVTTVSLFDHLKLSSAIASCLYLANDDENKFCMLEFDVSGIQKFIFKITEGKDTKSDIAKSLRGRSFFVSLVTDIITYSFLREFELTQSNIIFNTGGGALLLLPCVDNYETRIKNVSEEIMHSLYEMFGTDLTFVYSFVICNAKELETFKIEKAIELKKKLDIEKSRKMSKILNETFFFSQATSQHICKMCGTNFVTEDDLCLICKKIKDLSEFIVRHQNMFIVFDYENKLNDTISDCVNFKIGRGEIYLISENNFNKIVGKYDYIESLNYSKLGFTRFIANLVPQKNKFILSFEQIATQLIDEQFGDQKLGILKMDVDNLGGIFAFGLSHSRSLSKFLTLSRLIELFFSKHLVEICKNVSNMINPTINELSDNQNMFYINYAGGDDLVIIGPIAAILLLAQEINEKFNQYTLNQNISISGGIYIQTPKSPIRFGIQRAEECLSQSKSVVGKNCITLLNTTCKFSQFNQVIEKTDYFKYVINNDFISRSVFYSIMKLLDTEIFDNYLRAVPKILYSLKRNVLDDAERIQLIKCFNKISSIDELKILVLEMKLAIMQTRG